ncbi:radical SAM protein [Candidatus Woesearchaeota archaeon]|nr:radical SAM protein [Candidatus Woesearchaeota archaeon]
MAYTILDCYTDEPSGLGVPPSLGTYPRYIYGALRKERPYYLTIDDLRNLRKFGTKGINKENEIKTNTRIYNLTRSAEEVSRVLDKTTQLIVVSGINTPGKYLSAVPGTLSEITELIRNTNCRKILTGPAALIGSRLEGGKKPEYFDKTVYDEIEFNYLGINDYDKITPSAEIVEQIPYPIIAELETGKGCDIGKCSFCTEPLKSCVAFREPKDVVAEIKELGKQGVEHFRFGKQTCFYSYKNGDVKEIEKLLKTAAALKPKTLHIDNVNPNKVITGNGEKITKLVVKYCTPGNVAAFGVESFDIEVVKRNKLNTSPNVAYKAIQLINKYGAERGANGMPKLLPGVNLIFGLMNETKQTGVENFNWLKKIYDDGLMLRRINIRQVVPFEGTVLYEEAGTKFIKKNKKRYWSWRKNIRREIDYPMLQRLVPKDTIMKDVRMEIYDGNNTFGRQFGTYPLVVGIKKRLELGKYYDIKVVGHMLRSVIGEPV